jgi:hypothetical protein
MSHNHLMQKYHIGLFFSGLEVVATTKSPTLKVRRLEIKSNTKRFLCIKENHVISLLLNFQETY